MLRGETQQIRALDGRSVPVRLEPFSFRAVVAREGMPSKHGKGELVVHVFANWAELLVAARSWGRILMYLVGLWLFLTNPTLAIMLFFGYNTLRGAGAATN